MLPGRRCFPKRRVLLVGCGALGTVLAEQLVRAGVGTLRIADRDIVELTNLQRQVLFDEADAREGTPKAIAAAGRLSRINSGIVVDPYVMDLHAGNVEDLAGLQGDKPRVDLILDGTDNVETRYLLNDVSVKHGIPWLYGACVGMAGRMLAIRPPNTPCLRCLFPTPPSPGELPTCDTAGVFSPVAAIVASLQASAAIKMLVGKMDSSEATLYVIDPWQNQFRATSTEGAKRDDCTTCGKRQFEFLDTQAGSLTTSLCGRNSIQIRPPAGQKGVDLRLMADKLTAVGKVEQTPYLVRCQLSEFQNLQLTLFADGRLIVTGLNDPARARSLYARFIGS